MKTIKFIEEEGCFTTTNDESNLDLFEGLPLDYLCEISETSNKLEVEDYVLRKYPQHLQSMRIELRGGIVDLHNQSKCTKIFGRFIPSVTFLGNEEMDERVLQFMERYCSKNIKKIKFCDVTWTKSFADGMKEFVQNVESVTFFWLSYPSDVNLDEILKHMPFVRNLKVDCHKMVKLPTVECPNLETLEYSITGPLADDLAKFFQTNPSIKRFTCHMPNHNTDIDTLKQLLKIVIDNGNIEELFLSFGSKIWVNFALIRDELKMLDGRKNFKRLEIKSEGFVNASEVATLKSLTGIHLTAGTHFSSTYILNVSLQDISSLVNLKTLHVEGKMNRASAESLAQNLINLQEFYYIEEGDQLEKIETLYMPFVRHSPKLAAMILKTMAVTGCPDIEKLNAERGNLKDATKLDVHFDFLRKKKLRPVSSQGEFVNIQEAKAIYGSEPDYSSPLKTCKFVVKKGSN